MGLRTVRDGLKTRVEMVSGLRGYDTWPDTFSPPGAVIQPMRGDPHTTFSGRGSLWFEVVLAVQQSRLRTAQDQLDDLLDLSGAGSVLAAIEGDVTLAGAAEGLILGGWRDYGDIEIGGIRYLGAVIDVEVWVVFS